MWGKILIEGGLHRRSHCIPYHSVNCDVKFLSRGNGRVQEILLILLFYSEDVQVVQVAAIVHQCVDTAASALVIKTVPVYGDVVWITKAVSIVQCCFETDLFERKTGVYY